MRVKWGSRREFSAHSKGRTAGTDPSRVVPDVWPEVAVEPA